MVKYQHPLASIAILTRAKSGLRGFYSVTKSCEVGDE